MQDLDKLKPIIRPTGRATTYLLRNDNKYEKDSQKPKYVPHPQESLQYYLSYGGWEERERERFC